MQEKTEEENNKEGENLLKQLTSSMDGLEPTTTTIRTCKEQ